MNFVHPDFFIFIAIFLAPYYFLPDRGRLGWILAGSYVFYAYFSIPYCLLLLASTAVDFVLARCIQASTDPASRRKLACASLVLNLGLLGTFKYTEFVWNELVFPLAALGGYEIGTLPKGLPPVGISFFTFQTLSYTLDVYRGDLKPSRSWLQFASYVSLFPQLVAGPIVRARDLLPQLEVLKRARAVEVWEGAQRFAWGFLKKACIADSLALLFVDPCFRDVQSASPGMVLFAVLAYSFQIYFDFSGYSDMAIGLGRVLGFHFPENFMHPYRAASFSEFWQRWHISLSSWLRDYLYIPLGGNRGGPWRNIFNLMLTMLLGGLWHGASLLFVLWGLMHGVWLMLERLCVWALPEFWRARVPRPLKVLTCFVLVSLTWIPFRAGDSATMAGIVQALCQISLEDLRQTWQGLGWSGQGLLLAAPFSHYAMEPLWKLLRFSQWPLEPRVVVFTGLIFVGLHYFPESTEVQPFIYFQF